MTTDLYITINKGLMLLLISPSDENMDDSHPSLYITLCVPTLLILSFGVIGFIAKRMIGKIEKATYKLAYEMIVYDLFVCISIIFILPVAFNSIQFFSQ